MDHRWDEMLQAEHRRRVEEGRYGATPIVSDEDVARRDHLELARRRVNRSPWEIGAQHWDQRDLYTVNSNIDDSGYARGPSFHPEVGSYAYHRDVAPESAKNESLPDVYTREAYPLLNYQRSPSNHDGRLPDESVREEVDDALDFHPALDASHISVTVKNCEVTLDGTVGDKESKRLAETVAEACQGVEKVRNELEVVKSDDDLAFTSPIPVM